MKYQLRQDPCLLGTWNVFPVDDAGEPLAGPDFFMAIFSGDKSERLAREYFALKTKFPGDVMDGIAKLQAKVEWLAQPILR